MTTNSDEPIRIPGYSREGALEVPGTGPILLTYHKDGETFVVWSDGVQPQRWKASLTGWTKIPMPAEFPDQFSEYDLTGLCTVRDWAAEILKHGDTGELAFLLDGKRVRVVSAVTVLEDPNESI